MHELAVTQSKVKLKSTSEQSGSKGRSFISGFCSRKWGIIFLLSPAVVWSTCLVGLERVKNCVQRKQKGRQRGEIGVISPRQFVRPRFSVWTPGTSYPWMGCQSISGLPPALNSLAPSYTPEWKLVIYVNEVHCPRNTTQPAKARTQTCSLIRFQSWVKGKGTLSWSFLASNRRQIRSKFGRKLVFYPTLHIPECG